MHTDYTSFLRKKGTIKQDSQETICFVSPSGAIHTEQYGCLLYVSIRLYSTPQKDESGKGVFFQWNASFGGEGCAFSISGIDGYVRNPCEIEEDFRKEVEGIRANTTSRRHDCNEVQSVMLFSLSIRMEWVKQPQSLLHHAWLILSLYMQKSVCLLGKVAHSQFTTVSLQVSFYHACHVFCNCIKWEIGDWWCPCCYVPFASAVRRSSLTSHCRVRTADRRELLQGDASFGKERKLVHQILYKRNRIHYYLR